MAETFPSILCADDDATVLEVLKEYFTLKGFTASRRAMASRPAWS